MPPVWLDLCTLKACRTAAGVLVDPAGVLTVADVAEADALTAEQLYAQAGSGETEWDTESNGTLVAEWRSGGVAEWRSGGVAARWRGLAAVRA
jgi:hypothetical protein